MSERTLPTPDLHRTNCTIPGTEELQAGGGTGLWVAELWQKPTLGHVQGGYRRGDTGYTQINMPQPTCANLPSFAEKQAKELSEHHSLSHVQDF